MLSCNSHFNFKKVNPNQAVDGFKGFGLTRTGNKICRSYIFKDDVKVHTKKGDILLCAKGFHFCRSLSQVMQFYSIRPGRVYHKVKGHGDLCYDSRKIAARNLEIGKRLTFKEILKELKAKVIYSGQVIVKKKKVDWEYDVFSTDGTKLNQLGTSRCSNRNIYNGYSGNMSNIKNGDNVFAFSFNTYKGKTTTKHVVVYTFGRNPINLGK